MVGSCRPAQTAQPLASVTSVNLGTSNGSSEAGWDVNHERQHSAPSLDVATIRNGARIQYVVDAKQWKDSILVLDRNGLVWVLGPRPRPHSIERVVSLGQAFDGKVDRPLSLVIDERGFGVWDVESRGLYWFAADGKTGHRKAPVVSGDDLWMSAHRPLEPPRMHGRLVQTNGYTYLERRRASHKGPGPMVDAVLTRSGHERTDTVITYQAPSHAELRAGVWVCCGRPPFFAPQPWWSPLSDGRIVFTTGRSSELLLYSTVGTPLRRVSWSDQPNGRRASRKDLLEYLYEDTRREFAHASASYVQSLNKKIASRVDRFPGALSDTVPSLTQLLVDDVDRIWIRRFDRTQWPDGLSRTWDVFDSELRYLGPIQLPMFDYVFEVREGTILGSQIVHGALQRITTVSLRN
jgi:hypothetical protein